SKACLPLSLRGMTITPLPMHKFLGIIFDQALRWNAQVANTIAKGTVYVLQLRRLSTMSTGIPLTLMQQLYLAVTVPKMLYAIVIWFQPIYRGMEDEMQRGSIGIVRKLESIQRIALICTTGTMRTTASDMLEIHVNII
ncbi:hypothetical protein PAXRUDRAFT_124952, partial [Paxillus rubicundulus Ve08.2h10]